MMIAVCPACGHTADIEEPLPSVLSCPGCGAALSAKKEGLAVHLSPAAREADEEALINLRGEKDPVLKYTALTALERENPNSLSVQYALLMHGRLHERNPKKLDYSVIKCYLLHPDEEPDRHPPDERKAFAREIFDHPRLIKCLDLSPDPDAFRTRYLRDLCDAYIGLFLLGSSLYSGSFMGLFRSNHPEKTLAPPAASMMLAIRRDAHLSEDESASLAEAMYQAFESRFRDTSHIDRLLKGRSSS